MVVPIGDMFKSRRLETPMDRLTRRTARKLPTEPEVFEFDVTEPSHVAVLRSTLEERWGRVDGALHAIGFAPEACWPKRSHR